MQFNRDLEELKNKVRAQESECDRLQFRTQATTDENQKLQLKLEKKANEVH